MQVRGERSEIFKVLEKKTTHLDHGTLCDDATEQKDRYTHAILIPGIV